MTTWNKRKSFYLNVLKTGTLNDLQLIYNELKNKRKLMFAETQLLSDIICKIQEKDSTEKYTWEQIESMGCPKPLVMQYVFLNKNDFHRLTGIKRL